LIASSKLNGCSEIGLAFGIRRLPMASAIGHSSLHILAEHVSAGACSASCHDRSEDVRILALIMPEGKLRQIQRQIVLADVMEGAHDAALQQTPKTFQVIRVDVASHVFVLCMIHDGMRKGLAQSAISWGFISGDQRHSVSDGLFDKLTQRQTVRVLDQLAHYIALPRNRADHGRLLTLLGIVRLFTPMAVLITPADEGFVHFHFAHQLRKRRILHRRSNAMAHIPGRPVVAASNLAVDLQGTNPLLALCHEVNHLKPGPQGIVGILKHRLGDDRKAIAVPATTLLALTDPMKRTGFQRIHFLALAARAVYAVRPSLVLQKLLAGVFGGEAIHQRGQGESRLGGHGVLAFC